MVPIRTIVVPTDCSAVSRQALRFASGIATRSGGTVVAVYGATFSARMEGVGLATAPTCADDREQLMLPIRHCMEEALAATLAAATNRSIIVADQTPAGAVIEAAEERNADLIVMATRNRNRLIRAVLGSVTDSILHGSNRPVLLIHESTPDAPLRRILCPFRNTPQSIAAVREAKRLADMFGAELILLRVLDEKTLPGIAPEIAEVAREATLEELWLAPDPGPQIVALAAKRGADLLVLPAQHRRFSDPTVVGTPPSHIVRTARCPVLTVTAGTP
jgi:nucleotide-binding universal stress UspA family protein